MRRLQAKDHEEEDQDETETSKGSNWVYAAVGAVISALIPIFMSFSSVRQMQDNITTEMLMLVGILVILVVLLFALSARQRYNERVYLRAWQERRDRQRAWKLQRHAEARQRAAEEARRDSGPYQEDLGDADELPSSFEDRLLRSIGLDPAS